MVIQFSNKEGKTEVRLEEQRRFSVQSKEVIEFKMEIQHHPFTVEMPLDIYHSEVESFQREIEEMKCFHSYEAYLVSFYNDNAFHLVMDSSGHINANASISAGSRGSLKFTFEFDQSFLDRIIDSDDLNG